MKISLPDIPESERSPLVSALLAIIEQLVDANAHQAEMIQQLRDEIAVLKGEKARPKFKPSGMEQQSGNDTDESDDDDSHGGGKSDDEKTDETSGRKKRPGSKKRHKKRQLPIHETQVITPGTAIPADSTFKGYEDFIVQDIRFEVHNIRYRREIWQTPEGLWLRGSLPAYQQGQHFGPTLQQFILYQHHYCQVTQPLTAIQSDAA